MDARGVDHALLDHVLALLSPDELELLELDENNDEDEDAVLCLHLSLKLTELLLPLRPCPPPPPPLPLKLPHDHPLLLLRVLVVLLAVAGRCSSAPPSACRTTSPSGTPANGGGCWVATFSRYRRYRSSEKRDFVGLIVVVSEALVRGRWSSCWCAVAAGAAAAVAAVVVVWFWLFGGAVAVLVMMESRCGLFAGTRGGDADGG